MSALDLPPERRERSSWPLALLTAALVGGAAGAVFGVVLSVLAPTVDAPRPCTCAEGR